MFTGGVGGDGMTYQGPHMPQGWGGNRPQDAHNGMERYSTAFGTVGYSPTAGNTVANPTRFFQSGSPAEKFFPVPPGSGTPHISTNQFPESSVMRMQSPAPAAPKVAPAPKPTASPQPTQIAKRGEFAVTPNSSDLAVYRGSGMLLGQTG